MTAGQTIHVLMEEPVEQAISLPRVIALSAIQVLYVRLTLMIANTINAKMESVLMMSTPSNASVKVVGPATCVTKLWTVAL